MMRNLGLLGLPLVAFLLIGCGEKEVSHDEGYYAQNIYKLKNKLVECRDNPTKKDPQENRIHRGNCSTAQAVAFMFCTLKLSDEKCKLLNTYLIIDQFTLGVL